MHKSCRERMQRGSGGVGGGWGGEGFEGVTSVAKSAKIYGLLTSIADCSTEFDLLH